MGEGNNLSRTERLRSALGAAADRQHRLAREAASGAALRDLAALAGMSLDRTAALLARPAMAELIAHYRAAA